MRMVFAALALGGIFSGIALGAEVNLAASQPAPRVEQGFAGEEPIFLPPPPPPTIPDAVATPTPSSSGLPTLTPATGALPWDTTPAAGRGTPPPPPTTPVPPATSAVGVPLPASGQLSPPAAAGTPPAAVQAPAAPEQPLAARIRVEGTGKVNLRAGPGTEFEIITAALNGTPTTVFASLRQGQDEWYKIAFPETELVSVPAAFVQCTLPAEMPAEGIPGVINGDAVKVYARHWDRSTVVGEVQRGETVTVKRVRGSWLQIVPPPSARAYCFAQYIQLMEKPTAVIPTDAAPAQNPNLAAVTVDGKKTDKKAAGPKLPEKLAQARENYYARIQKNWDGLIDNEDEEIRRMQEAWKNRPDPLKQFDEALTSVQSRYFAAVNVPDYRSPGADRVLDPTQTGFTGWVEYVGRYGNHPGAFRLTKGGETQFFLRSNKVKLEDFAQRRVWVNGYSETAPGAPASVLVVEDIRTLWEPGPADPKPTVVQRFPDTGPIADPRDAVNPVVVDHTNAGQAQNGKKDLPETIQPNVIPMGRSSAAPLPDAVAPGMAPTVYAPNSYAPSATIASDPAVVVGGTPGISYSSYTTTAPVIGNGVEVRTTETITTTTTTIPVRPGVEVVPAGGGVVIQDYAIPASPSAPLPSAVPGELPAYVGP